MDEPPAPFRFIYYCPVPGREGADEYYQCKPGQHGAGYPDHSWESFRLFQRVSPFQGTGSSAQNLSFFDTMIASMGYPVISLDYPDNVITTVCSNSKDSSCFDGFRQ